MNESNKKLKELLQDNESKEIFDARIEYMRTRDTLAFIEKMHNLYFSLKLQHNPIDKKKF